MKNVPGRTSQKVPASPRSPTCRTRIGLARPKLLDVAISKVERLTNLVIALLSTRGYISAEKIRSNVAGYSDSPNT
jgi:hypothetical protein